MEIIYNFMIQSVHRIAKQSAMQGIAMVDLLYKFGIIKIIVLYVIIKRL